MVTSAFMTWQEEKDAWRAATLVELKNEVEAKVKAEVEVEVKAKVKAEVEVEVKAKVKAEGKAETLSRLLQRRFGILPSWVELRIGAAVAAFDVTQLDAWADVVIDGPSLEAIFGEVIH